MKQIFLFSIGLVMLIASSCQTNLPQPTQTGIGTLGMKVNGKTWVAGGYLNTFAYASFYKVDGSTVIWSDLRNDVAAKSTLYMIVNGISGKGFYNMGNINRSFGEDSSRFVIAGDYRNSYFPVDKNSSLVTITQYDSIHKIISATFTANLINRKKDTVRITEGRFDLKYIVIQ